MSHISELWSSCIVFGPIFSILFGTSCGSLVLGFLKYNECPSEPHITQGLVGFGLIGSVCSVVALILVVVSFFHVDDSGTHLWYFVYAHLMLAIYGLGAVGLAVIIAIAFYVPGSYCPLKYLPNLQPFCDGWIYHFSYIFAVIVLTLTCVISVLLVLRFVRKCCKSLRTIFSKSKAL